MNKDEIIKIFLKHNFNVSVEALNFLIKSKISKKTLKLSIQKIPTNLSVINLSTLQKHLIIDSKQEKEEADHSISVPKIISINKKEATDVAKCEEEIQTDKTPEIVPTVQKAIPKIKIIMDIPERSSEKPNIETFRELFLNRYYQLFNILKDNIVEQETIIRHHLSKDEIPKDNSGILIGMVQDTRVLHTNKFVIQLENPESEVLTRCVMVQDSESFPEYRDILRDSVVGIKGVLPKKFQGGDVTAFWGKDIIRPSFNKRQFRFTTEAYKILFISDIHFGSQYFIRSIFANLIKLLSSKSQNSYYEKLGSEITTLIIGGDLVEGIGLFPSQKDTILYHSLQSQYEGLSILLQEIPKKIEIIVIPGEHDATQIPNPQPPIDKEIGKKLTEISNLKSCGNPIRLAIDDMTILAFHGQKNEVLFEKHFHLSPTNPIIGIQHLLEYRHLYPEYGSFNPIAPVKRDYLVIDEIPDVIVSGHFHQAYYKEYKGVKIMTCGSFQREEKSKNKEIINNSLGIFPILDTEKGIVDMIDLKKI